VPTGADAGTPTPTPATSDAAAKDAGSADAGKTVPPPPRKKVCLTFYDGPQHGTQHVLAALGSIKSTFFLTGKNMAANQSLQANLVAAILAAGHTIGNHTYSHSPEKLSGYQDLASKPKAEQATAIQGNMTKNQEYFKKLFEDQKAEFTSQGITTLPGFEFARLPGSGKEFPQFVQLVKDMGLIPFPWQTEFAPSDAPGFGHIKYRDWQGVKGVRGEHSGCPADGWIILSHDRLWLGKQAELRALIDKMQAGCNCDFGTLDSSGTCS
jgi:peptidoglycan/xylan/chitin deacetylase (PgdA/CDA1 family)